MCAVPEAVGGNCSAAESSGQRTYHHLSCKVAAVGGQISYHCGGRSDVPAEPGVGVDPIHTKLLSGAARWAAAVAITVDGCVS